MPVARRVLGQNDELMLKTRSVHAEAFYRDPNATLDDLREAVTTIEDLERIARRVLGECHDTTLKTRWICAASLYQDDCATLDDLREAVTTLEDAGRIARRVLGSAHPTTGGIEDDLRDARAALCARETPPY